MNKLNEYLRKYEIKPIRYQRQGKTTIVDTVNNKYVLKENSYNSDIYSYLKSRSFDYFPRIISDINDKYQISLYEEGIDYPEEQKIFDMIDLVSLLHSKTSFYKEIDNDEYIEIYEDLNNNIEYLFSYYNDLITIIESKVYMSPYEYLLARNITTVFNRLEEEREELTIWYNTIKSLNKVRYVAVHNNLELSHFIKNENSYLISWDKSKIDMPIFDIYKLYIKNNFISIEDILSKYEAKYPLLNHEKMLLFILIKIPTLPNLTSDEYTNTKSIRNILLNIEKTKSLVLPNNFKDEPNH